MRRTKRCCESWCGRAKRLKKDQLRHRRTGWGSFCCATVSGPRVRGEAWTKKYLNWIRIHVRFDQPALEAAGHSWVKWNMQRNGSP